MKKILLFSGGIDSFTAWHFLDHPPTVYFYTSVHASHKELATVTELAPSTIIDTSLNFGLREHGVNAYIPFRNLIMACQATKYGDEVVLAGLKDDVVNDKNEAIFAEWSGMMSRMEGREIKVTSPFWQMTKADVVKWYLEAGLPKDRLLATTSCYSGGMSRYCGACPSCFRKWNALWVNDIKIEFANTEMLLEYARKAESGQYIPERNESILKAVKEFLG